MSTHFTNRLADRIRQTGSPVCVGIDPVYERLPESLRGKTPPTAGEAVQAIVKYTQTLLETIATHTACVKFQSACFERYLWPGVEAYHHLIDQARQMGFIVIGDAKRGDIGISAAHYAAGCLADTSYKDLGELRGPDALTINPYMGPDTIEPFISVAAEQGKGLFALVRTSNPGSDAVQALKLQDGRSVAQSIAQNVAALGSGHLGENGYSLLGAVVGATKQDDIAVLREAMPQQIFLVPGFGAQGGTAEDIKPCFKADGSGAIITASRSVIYAYENSSSGDWPADIERAAVDLNRQIAALLG